MIGIKGYDVRIAIEAFKRGLTDDSELYRELTKYPCTTFEEVRTRALAQMRLEDNLAIRNGVQPLPIPNNDRVSRKHNDRKNWRHRTYDKPGQVNAVNNVKTNVSHDSANSSQKQDADAYPDIAEYGFCVDIGGVVNALHSLGNVARWPRKSDRPDENKDKSKWCDYRGDHGHRTEDCNALRKEIAFLLKKGHLKELLGKGKSSSKEATTQQQKDPQQPPKGPTVTKVVNVITGGSDICGLTYSAARKIARTGNPEEVVPMDARSNQDKALEAMVLAFDECDLGDYREEHHDSLVISLTIGNCLLKRVLVDRGSSSNVLFKSTLEDMGIDARDIVRKSTVIVGFSGEALNTSGEIVLPTFAGGVNLSTHFNVVDCPSAYNAIIGRPWIHRMKVVPSTYHQVIKFPTKWGVQIIKGERQEARRCYSSTLKTSKRTV
ncbi:uncharacterized protein LOC110713576 [Chenopodium quinoa]|uniref:uncharacterized protein LOC110713576 n=1 Tax=Chenopodium quinoa TaxID=63459 RepID=UPI000B78126B|nr:uncharacterized protein LOC110713576 [Chenopodium quinoa]